MRKEKPSRTAYKVALNILALNAKPGMDIPRPSPLVSPAHLLHYSTLSGQRPAPHSNLSRTLFFLYNNSPLLLQYLSAYGGLGQSFCVLCC